MWITICRSFVSTARRIVRHAVLHPIRAVAVTAPAFGSLAWLLTPTPLPSPPINPNCGCRQVWVPDNALKAAYEKYHGQPYLQLDFPNNFNRLSLPRPGLPVDFVETVQDDSNFAPPLDVPNFAVPSQPVQVGEPPSSAVLGTALLMLFAVFRVRREKCGAAGHRGVLRPTARSHEHILADRPNKLLLSYE